jgi:hypothetical protein
MERQHSPKRGRLGAISRQVGGIVRPRFAENVSKVRYARQRNSVGSESEPRPAGGGGKPQQYADLWLAARIHYFEHECRSLGAGSIARLFLKKARDRYRQYRRYGLARRRYLCWSCLDQVAEQLVGCAACSSNQLPSQEEAR